MFLICSVLGGLVVLAMVWPLIPDKKKRTPRDLDRALYREMFVKENKYTKLKR